MLEAVSHVAVWVHDQDDAKAFYTEKLGFEVREDAERAPSPGARSVPAAARFGSSDGPGRDRTYDLRIMSPLL